VPLESTKKTTSCCCLEGEIKDAHFPNSFISSLAKALPFQPLEFMAAMATNSWKTPVFRGFPDQYSFPLLEGKLWVQFSGLGKTANRKYLTRFPPKLANSRVHQQASSQIGNFHTSLSPLSAIRSFRTRFANPHQATKITKKAFVCRVHEAFSP
jgi:hypothetical protein